MGIENRKNEAGPGLSLIIPAFNEEGGIRDVIKGIREILGTLDLPSEVIVVDDGSTDGTMEVLRHIPGIRYINHEVNRGYGAAIKTGIREARYPWICITDADGTYPSSSIPQLVDAMSDNEMVVGARTGSNVRIPLVRRPAKWVLTKIANHLAQQKIPDLNSGLRIFSKNVTEQFLNILPNQFSFTTTITLAMLMQGHRVRFIPIEYYKRVGKSKIRPIYDTLNFLQLIIRTILFFDPLRIFLPFSLLFLFIGAVLFILRIILGGGFGVSSMIFFTAGIQFIAIGMLADLIDRRTRP